MIDTMQCDLLVVGAGPAGLAAATLAANLGGHTGVPAHAGEEAIRFLARDHCRIVE